MLWLLVAYPLAGLVATILYVRLAPRLEVPPAIDPEAEWWKAFGQARERLGHDPAYAEVLQEMQRAA